MFVFGNLDDSWGPMFEKKELKLLTMVVGSEVYWSPTLNSVCSLVFFLLFITSLIIVHDFFILLLFTLNNSS